MTHFDRYFAKLGGVTQPLAGGSLMSIFRRHRLPGLVTLTISHEDAEFLAALLRGQVETERYVLDSLPESRAPRPGYDDEYWAWLRRSASEDRMERLRSIMKALNEGRSI